MKLRETTLGQFQELAVEARALGRRFVAMVREFSADHLTPVGIYAQVAQLGKPSALLESVPQGQHVGRFSCIALNPMFRFVVRNGLSQVECIESAPDVGSGLSDPLTHLGHLLQVYTPHRSAEVPPLGPAVGYVGYEAAQLIEPAMVMATSDVLGVPDVCLVFFRSMIVVDHLRQSVSLIVSTPINGDFEQQYNQAQLDLSSLEQFLKNGLLPLEELPELASPITSNHTRASHAEMVARAQRYISDGDIFQAVLSQRFHARLPKLASSLAIYRHLRRLNPSPYLYHIDLGHGIKLIGASPEVMVELKGDVIRVKPIAGTRKRGKDEEEDARLAKELLADIKELAEHMMLIDLARNDVGHCALPGTVELVKAMVVELYATVMHIVSEVHGKRDPKVSPLEVLWRCIPAGTLVGAPKVRATAIIAELERQRRGPYGGMVGWIGVDAFDTAICIRSMVVVGDEVYWQSGGGIVADSTAEGEFDETLAKGRSIGQLFPEAWDAFVRSTKEGN